MCRLNSGPQCGPWPNPWTCDMFCRHNSGFCRVGGLSSTKGTLLQGDMRRVPLNHTLWLPPRKLGFHVPEDQQVRGGVFSSLGRSDWVWSSGETELLLHNWYRRTTWGTQVRDLGSCCFSLVPVKLWMLGAVTQHEKGLISKGPDASGRKV